MKKRFWKMAALGFLLGVAVNSLISALAAGGSPVAPELLERIGSLRWAMLLEFVLVGVFGAACMAAMTAAMKAAPKGVLCRSRLGCRFFQSTT